MLYSSDLRLLSQAGALCRLTLRAPLGSPSWAAVESGDFTAAASFVQRYGRWYSCLQLYTNLDPEDTVTLKRGLSSWQLCDPLLGATSFILSFLWSQQPSPPRAAGDLGPNRSGAPGTSPHLLCWSLEPGWTYSSVQWATSRACAGPPLGGGVSSHLGGHSPLSSWHPRRWVLDPTHNTLAPAHVASGLLGCSFSAVSFTPHPFPEPSLHHRGEGPDFWCLDLRGQRREGQSGNKAGSPRSAQSAAFAPSLPGLSQAPHLLRHFLTQRGRETPPWPGAEGLQKSRDGVGRGGLGLWG